MRRRISFDPKILFIILDIEAPIVSVSVVAGLVGWRYERSSRCRIGSREDRTRLEEQGSRWYQWIVEAAVWVSEGP